MATFTSFLNLRKPATSDNIDVTLDISNNMDEIDTAIETLAGRVDAIEGAWQSWTPTLTSWTATISRAKYIIIGKTVIGQLRGVVTGFSSGISGFSLPVAPHSGYTKSSVGETIGQCGFVDASTGARFDGFIVTDGPSTAMFTASGNQDWNPAARPVPWAVNDVLTVNFVYEKA